MTLLHTALQSLSCMPSWLHAYCDSGRGRAPLIIRHNNVTDHHGRGDHLAVRRHAAPGFAAQNLRWNGAQACIAPALVSIHERPGTKWLRTFTCMRDHGRDSSGMTSMQHPVLLAVSRIRNVCEAELRTKERPENEFWRLCIADSCPRGASPQLTEETLTLGSLAAHCALIKRFRRSYTCDHAACSVAAVEGELCTWNGPCGPQQDEDPVCRLRVGAP